MMWKRSRENNDDIEKKKCCFEKQYRKEERKERGEKLRVSIFDDENFELLVKDYFVITHMEYDQTQHRFLMMKEYT